MRGTAACAPPRLFFGWVPLVLPLPSWEAEVARWTFVSLNCFLHHIIFKPPTNAEAKYNNHGAVL